ncbi:hypothetical protein M9H77_34305 [Catharanthus roseus]|uniref:Uncharacterized protein n=1 Tax=Catharanthus roseus TaxID=4058 RepID=A0ACB9ZLI9_CATRO|nr:hypothetical protein M9H77_34305 [Catharanthus roseus]
MSIYIVSRTRASSDGVDVSNSGELIYLKRGIDREGCGTIGLSGNTSCSTVGFDRLRSHSLFSISCFLLILTQNGQRYNKPLNLVPRGTQIPYSVAVNLIARLGVSQNFKFTCLFRFAHRVINLVGTMLLCIRCHIFCHNCNERIYRYIKLLIDDGSGDRGLRLFESSKVKLIIEDC